MGLSLRGQSSGAIDINAPNIAGNNTITLPGSNGAANQFYKNSATAGTLTHSTMVEISSGQIGLGVINPEDYDSEADDLVISSGGSDTGITLVCGASVGNHGSIFFADGTGSSGAKKKGQIRYEQNNEKMSFFTNEQQRLTIDLSGNAGIGTDAPNRRLHIAKSNTTAYDSTDFDQDYQTLKLENYADNHSAGIQFLIGDNGEAAITATETSDGETNLSFGTRGSGSRSEKFVIYPTGSILKPANPRFWARLAADQTSYDGRNVGGTWVTYDTVEYNIGNHFKITGSDTGRFVAPVAGMYLFHASAFISSAVGASQSWFDVDDGRQQGTDWVLSGAFDVFFVQNTIQVYLTANQKIGFHPYNNETTTTIGDSVHHTWFKGCLLG